MRARRLLTPAIVAMALVPLVAPPASAAPPANDEVGGAVAVAVGDRIEQDTTEATTNAGDDALNENCGAPATNASVWFQYTPATDRKVAFDASESSYEAGLMIFKGTPTAQSLRSCGPFAAGIRAKAGKTYNIMVFADEPSVNGGSMVLSVLNAPTPHVHMTLAKRGVAFHGGAARVHGTYRCTHADSFGFLGAILKQRAGRLKISGQSETAVRCNGKRHKWSTRVVSPVGTYARGKAVAKATIFACGLIECRIDKVSHHVHLAWAKAHGRTGLPPTTRTVRPHPLVGVHRYWPSR